MNRRTNKWQSRSRDPLERRMDQWIENGRQLVDGVAGTRPGKRNKANLDKTKFSRFKDVGKWVEGKIDWMFEDEDDWIRHLEANKTVKPNFSQGKKPLEAISLRVPKAIAPSKTGNDFAGDQDHWPEESSFRLERWSRADDEISKNRNGYSDSPRQNRSSNNRPLPRSNRRRS